MRILPVLLPLTATLLLSACSNPEPAPAPEDDVATAPAEQVDTVEPTDDGTPIDLEVETESSALEVAVSDAVNDAMEAAENLVSDATSETRDAAETAVDEAVTAMTEAVVEPTESIVEELQSVAEGLVSEAEEVVDTASQSTQDAVEAAEDVTTETIDSASEAVAEASEVAQNTVEEVTDEVTSATEETQTEVTDAVGATTHETVLAQGPVIDTIGLDEYDAFCHLMPEGAEFVFDDTSTHQFLLLSSLQQGFMARMSIDGTTYDLAKQGISSDELMVYSADNPTRYVVMDDAAPYEVTVNVETAEGGYENTDLTGTIDVQNGESITTLPFHGWCGV